MSASVFEVFIEPTKRPTFAAFNAALAKHDYPMRVVPAKGQQDSDLLTDDGRYMLETRVVIDGEEQVVFLEEMSVGIGLEGAEETNERLEECGSPFRVTDDDHVMMTTFGRDIPPKYLVPGVLMNVVMINDFGGYGFDGESMVFGREDYANEMLSWIASDLKPQNLQPQTGNREAGQAETALEPSSSPKPANAPETTVAPHEEKKFRWTLWRILFALIALMFVAEFIDKFIYNFTGTGS